MLLASLLLLAYLQLQSPCCRSNPAVAYIPAVVSDSAITGVIAVAGVQTGLSISDYYYRCWTDNVFCHRTTRNNEYWTDKSQTQISNSLSTKVNASPLTYYLAKVKNYMRDSNTAPTQYPVNALGDLRKVTGCLYSMISRAAFYQWSYRNTRYYYPKC
jgi:hypothetical protein